MHAITTEVNWSKLVHQPGNTQYETQDYSSDDRAISPDHTSDRGMSPDDEEHQGNEAGLSHQTEVSGKHASSDQTYRPDLDHEAFPDLEHILGNAGDIQGSRNRKREQLYQQTLDLINKIYPEKEDRIRTFALINTKLSKNLSITERNLRLVLRNHLKNELTEQDFEKFKQQKYYRSVEHPRTQNAYKAIYDILHSGSHSW